MYWEITDKGDPDALALVDGVTELIKGRSGFGKPHYSRQTPGSRFFTRNGQNLVFITPDKLAVWVTFRPTPGKAVRPDKRDAWECALFRNEGKTLSSLLIKEAVELSCAIWGQIPPDGFITFIRPDKTTYRRSKKSLPGACYIHAGWVEDKPSSDGKPCLSTTTPINIPDIREWNWASDRGGILRKEIEERIKDMTLRVIEPQEPYNTKEDLLELVDAYKQTKQRQEIDDPWALADLAHEAAQKFDLKQFAKLTGENINTLRTYSKIAGVYEKSNRYSLSFKHHMVTAYSDKRDEWLKKAQDNAWSAERLRKEMNPPKPVEKKEPVPERKIEPNPVADVKPAIVFESKPAASQNRTLEEVVEALNWYMFNDRKALEFAASNALVFISMLFGEDRLIVFDQDTGKYEISVSKE